MLSWMESRWRHQEGGGHPGQQYGEQQCCRRWCSWEMSDSNHSIPDKARPVRINANKSGMWAGMDAGAIESNFYILERQPSDTILDTGRQHSEQTRGILRNSVKLVPDYPTPQGWQFSNFVSGSCRGCQETLAVSRCVRNTVCIFCSEQPAVRHRPRQCRQAESEDQL